MSSTKHDRKRPYRHHDPSATFEHYPTANSRMPIYKRNYSEDEVAASPTIERAKWHTQIGHPPSSSTEPQPRYRGQETAYHRRTFTTDPVIGRRRNLDGAPPGTSPLEPLAQSTTAVGSFLPGEPVQAFYEPDQRWYDARVIKTVPRIPKPSNRNLPLKNIQSHATVVKFDDGFPGEHVVDNVRSRSLYPLNLAKNPTLPAHTIPKFSKDDAGGQGSTFTNSKAPRFTKEQKQRKTFPFKYGIPGRLSVLPKSMNSDPRAPFRCRVVLDKNDLEADRFLIKKFRDYYFGEKDVVDGALISKFKVAVAAEREKQLRKVQETPRPLSALPAGRRVPDSWMKRNRLKLLPTKSNAPPRRLRKVGGKVAHKYKNRCAMGPEPMPITVLRRGKSLQRIVRRQPRIGWKDYIWSHMHNWHFSGTGPSSTSKLQYESLFRAAKQNKARRERLFRDLEAVSSFRLDLTPLNRMLENISNRTITRAEAKDMAVVIVKRALTGCGHGEAPISALRVHSVEGSAQVKEAQELERNILQRVLEAIDEDWGPGDSSGDLGPSLKWNMSHPGLDVILSLKKSADSRESPEHRSQLYSGSNFPCSHTSKTKKTQRLYSKQSSLGGKAVKILLDKDRVKSWVACSKSLASTPNGIPADSTIELSFEGSKLGILSAAELLASHLFQLLPRLIVLDLTRAGMDSRAFEALADGLTVNSKSTNKIDEPSVSGLQILIVDSNFITRGKPVRRKKGFSNPHGNSEHSFYETTLKGLELFGKAIRNHPKLNTLSLRKNALGINGSRRLIRILTEDSNQPHKIVPQHGKSTLYAAMRSLTSLSIESNAIMNKGIASVREMTLGPSAVLKSLNVAHNSIDQAGIHSFFEPPKRDINTPRSLKTLIMRHNKFSLQSVQTLVSSLRSVAWRLLSKLDVSFCSMGDIGAGLLANLLKSNSSITSLHLKGCGLTDNGTKFRGVLELIGVLRDENRYVRELDLSANSLICRRLGRFNDDERCGWELANMIRNNRTLARVDLRGNAFGMKIRIALKTALKESPMASLQHDCKIAFWMCKQKRLGANSPARVLWYGMLMYICGFLALKRDEGEILF